MDGWIGEGQREANKTSGSDMLSPFLLLHSLLFSSRFFFSRDSSEESGKEEGGEGKGGRKEKRSCHIINLHLQEPKEKPTEARMHYGKSGPSHINTAAKKSKYPV